MGSSKGAPASMKVEQRRRAAEAKREANRRARQQKRNADRQPAPTLDVNLYTLRMRLPDTTPNSRMAAYEALRMSGTLRTYERKYKHHEPRQLAVMAGSLEVTVPFCLAKQIERELFPAWTKASIPTEATVMA